MAHVSHCLETFRAGDTNMVDCEKECRKHEDHRAERKACADACADVVKAPRALVG